MTRLSVDTWKCKLILFPVPGDMRGSDSDCESLDSGLETGNSNLEASEAGCGEAGASEDSELEDKRPTSAESQLSDFR